MPTFKTNKQIAEEVARRHEGDIYQIRRDASRTERWKKIELAKVAREMRAERQRLMAERDRESRGAQVRLENTLFGSGSKADDASAVISRRDAGDRAAQLDDEEAARRLLARAERTGDEPLARAIAERAFERRWVNVTNEFLERRPELDAPMNELWSQRHPSMNDALVEILTMDANPEELSGLSEFDIDRLAEADPVEAPATSFGRPV